MAWRDRDHTRGSLLVSLLVLALPLLAQSAGQATYQLVDLAFVSRLGEDATTAVIVTNQALRQAFLMLVMGASFGAQGLVARHVGSGRVDAAEHVAGQTVLLGLGASAVIAVVGVTFAPEMLRALQVAPSVLALGVPYARWVFLLAFLFVFLALFNGILQGAGDSATPLRITLVQTSCALVAEWILIFGHAGLPALGVEGVIFGLATGQLVGVALALRVLFRGTSRVHLRLHHLAPDAAALRRIGALAWPPALQMLGGFLVNVFFIGVVGRFGEKAQAAYAIGLRLSLVGPMLAFPLAGACATLVGQNLGLGRADRSWRAIRVGLLVHGSLMGGLAVVLATLREPIMGLFSDDPAVIAIGTDMLLFQAGTFGAWAFFFVFFRALQGAGDVTVPMMLSLGNSLLVTLPLGLWLSIGLGWEARGVFAATMAGAVTVTCATGAWLATGRWTRRGPVAPAAPEAGGAAGPEGPH